MHKQRLLLTAACQRAGTHFNKKCWWILRGFGSACRAAGHRGRTTLLQRYAWSDSREGRERSTWRLPRRSIEDVRDSSGRPREMSPALKTPLLVARKSWPPVTPQESRLMSGIMNEQRTARRYGRAPAPADSRSPGIGSAFRGFCSTPKFGAHFSLPPAAVRKTPSGGGRMRRPEKRTWLIKCSSTRRTRRRLGWSCCAAIG